MLSSQTKKIIITKKLTLALFFDELLSSLPSVRYIIARMTMLTCHFPFGTKEYQIIRSLCFRRLQAKGKLDSLEDLIQDVSTTIYEKVQLRPDLLQLYTQNTTVFKTEVFRTIFTVSKKMFGAENELKVHLYSKVSQILKNHKDIDIQGKYCFWSQEVPKENISHIQAHWTAQNGEQLPPIIQKRDPQVLDAISFYMQNREMVEVWDICNFVWNILSPSWEQITEKQEYIEPNFLFHFNDKKLPIEVSEEEYWLLVSYGLTVATDILKRYSCVEIIEQWKPSEVKQAQVLFDCFTQTLRYPELFRKKNGAWNVAKLAESCNSTAPTMKKILDFVFQDIRTQIEGYFPGEVVSMKTQVAVLELLIQLCRE